MSALQTAWQGALAAEHEAAYGYSLLGPRLSGADLDAAVACSNAHEALRNRIEAAMVRSGIEPVQSRADYPALYAALDAPLQSSRHSEQESAAARAVAIRLEDGCAAAWRRLFAVAAGTGSTAELSELLGEALRALTASATRALRWRVDSADADPTVPFPGTNRT